MREERTDDVDILGVEGGFGRKDEAEILATRLRDLAGEGRRKLVVDLAGVARVSDTFVGELIRGWIACHRQGTHLVLCCSHRRILDFFRIVRLDRTIPICHSEGEALELLGRIEAR